MIAEYIPYLLTALGALIALTNIAVEVLKQVIPNDLVNTSILAIIIAMIFSVGGFFGFAAFKEITIQWYYVAGAIVLGFLVAYGAMFGYDKLKEIIDELNKN